nr:hypothetical protein [Tanacetum cinerariifolium]
MPSNVNFRSPAVTLIPSFSSNCGRSNDLNNTINNSSWCSGRSNDLNNTINNSSWCRRGVLLLMLTNNGLVDGNGSNLGGGFGKPGGGRETHGGGDRLEGPGGQLSMA